MQANIFSFDSTTPGIVYLDASFIVNFSVEGSKYHEPCTKFVRKLCKENVPSLVSNLTLDEIWYSLIKVSLIKDFGDKYASLLFAIFPRMTRKWYVEIRDEPEILQKYVPLIKRVMADISMLQNVILVEVKTEMTLKAIDFIGKYSLLPRDAIHLATMLGLGVKNIVTTDIDFTRVKDINVYTCNYKVPGQIK